METKGETASMIPEKQVICYKTIGETEITADVYLPEGASKPMPLFFYIHSGGWIDGKADELLVNFTDLTERLFADGVALVSIRYRFALNGLDYHAPITDSIDALRFFYDRADEFGFDRDRIFIGGTSAGGHLTLTTAFAQSAFGSDPAHPTIRPCALIDMCGPVNFMEHGPVRSQKNSDALLRNFLGGPDEEVAERAAEASPITYIRKYPADQLMPVIAVHGSLDELVNIDQPLCLQAAYAAANAPFELVTVENGKHSFKAVEGYPPPSLSYAEIQEKIYTFVKTYVY